MTQRQSTEARRGQIADATLKIIGRDGVGGFTTLAIAREVGIAEGTIFRHFGSKQEVVLAAIARLEELLFGDIPVASSDPIDDLGRFFRGRMRLMGRTPALARLFFSEALAQAAGPIGAKLVKAMQQKSLDFMRDRLEQAVSLGLTRPGVDAEALLLVVHGTALALVHGSMLASTKEPLSKRADRVWPTIEALIRR
jgi:AcrR family transcriptional regulator